jgi:hypothetical protein
MMEQENFLPKGKFWITTHPISITKLPIIDPARFASYDKQPTIELRKAVKKCS